MAGLTGPGTGQTSQTPSTGDPLNGMYRRSQLVLVGAFVMLVGAVIVTGEFLHGNNVRVVAVVLALTAAATLFARRRWPGWTHHQNTSNRRRLKLFGQLILASDHGQTVQ